MMPSSSRRNLFLTFGALLLPGACFSWRRSFLGQRLLSAPVEYYRHLYYHGGQL